MNPEELEEIRKGDITFFAKRYSELFARYFDRYTDEEQAEFRTEIEQALSKIKYEINPKISVTGAPALASGNTIMFDSEETLRNERTTRIHELVHAYNFRTIDSGGLRDEANGLKLPRLDEGSTDLIASMINYNGEVRYIEEVSIVKLLISIVGEEKMIMATKYGASILEESLVDTLKTKGILEEIEKNWIEADQIHIFSENREHFLDNIYARMRYYKLMSFPKLANAIKTIEDDSIKSRFLKQYDEEEMGRFYIKEAIQNDEPTILANEMIASLQERITSDGHSKEISIKDNIRLELQKSLYTSLINKSEEPLLYDQIDYDVLFIPGDVSVNKTQYLTKRICLALEEKKLSQHFYDIYSEVTERVGTISSLEDADRIYQEIMNDIGSEIDVVNEQQKKIEILGEEYADKYHSLSDLENLIIKLKDSSDSYEYGISLEIENTKEKMGFSKFYIKDNEGLIQDELILEQSDLIQFITNYIKTDEPIISRIGVDGRTKINRGDNINLVLDEQVKKTLKSLGINIDSELSPMYEITKNIIMEKIQEATINEKNDGFGVSIRNEYF